MASAVDNDDTLRLLRDHPIFSLPSGAGRDALELSTNTLPKFTSNESSSQAPSGRRQAIILKDADIIVAAGKEIRMSSFGDIKLTQSVRKSYKVLHTPNVQFEIHQMALNPTGKLLAVAGAREVAVIVLPRPGYSRLVPAAIDCKAVQVGQFYHSSVDSCPIAKIDWHPWGEAGATLLVMTADGKLREYDISRDTDEPQQVLSFVPERKSRSFMPEDDTEREVASFTLGKGRADWGPLTVYAVMKSGDVYAISPYLPKYASVPSAYVHSLECFIAAKQEFLSEKPNALKTLSMLYDYQRKYVNALIKQLPAGLVFPAESRSVEMTPPTTISAPPLRQGPFLLQPAPQLIEGSDGANATDIVYVAFGTDNEDEESSDTEHLGVIMVSYQDGKVDLFLDVEKVEARWDLKKTSSHDLPMLATYESIDLGLIDLLNNGKPAHTGSGHELLQGNHPTFVADPLHDDVVYIYHAFGVHAIDVAPVLNHLSSSLKNDNDQQLEANLKDEIYSNVLPILNTYSVDRKSSNPVIAVAVPNDVYLTYSMLTLTSSMRFNSIPLNMRAPPPITTAPSPLSASTSEPNKPGSAVVPKSKWLTAPDSMPAAYKCTLGEPYQPPKFLTSSMGLPPVPKQALPQDSKEFMLTPETLRFLATAMTKIAAQCHELVLAYRLVTSRMTQQDQEWDRHIKKITDLESKIQALKTIRKTQTQERFTRVQEEQKRLVARLDRLLQAMMEKASPSLSEHETKWFGELKRMKAEVLGSGKFDEDSLLARTRMLEKEYARILPALKALTEKEKQYNQKRADNNNLGFSQAFDYGQQSQHNQVRIETLKKKVTALTSSLEAKVPGGSQSS